MVVIRLTRGGTKHIPKYRVTVADQKYAPTGRYIEVVGHFNPHPSQDEEGLKLDMGKIKAWMAKGAQPTRRVQSLIRKFEGAKK